MPDDLKWSWCNNKRNKVHSKCNELESSWNHPNPSPGPLKNYLAQNWSLVPKRMGTAVLENEQIQPLYDIRVRTEEGLHGRKIFKWAMYFLSSQALESWVMCHHSWRKPGMFCLPILCSTSWTRFQTLSLCSYDSLPCLPSPQFPKSLSILQDLSEASSSSPEISWLPLLIAPCHDPLLPTPAPSLPQRLILLGNHHALSYAVLLPRVQA